MGINGNNERYGQEPSHSSHISQGFLKKRGDYRTLLSYQKAEVVYQITYRFCNRFLTRGDRTNDQMIQAARSGKQNIIEGSKAALVPRSPSYKSHGSYKTYRKLVEISLQKAVATLPICLIHQTNYLLDRQINNLEKNFLKDGGLRERMTKPRLLAREKPSFSHSSHISHTSHKTNTSGDTYD